VGVPDGSPQSLIFDLGRLGRYVESEDATFHLQVCSFLFRACLFPPQGIPARFGYLVVCFASSWMRDGIDAALEG